MKLATQQISDLTSKGFCLAQPSTVLAIHLLGLGDDTYFEDERGVFVFIAPDMANDHQSSGTRNIKGAYVALHPKP